jgi:hypothetical protein
MQQVLQPGTSHDLYRRMKRLSFRWQIPHDLARPGHRHQRDIARDDPLKPVATYCSEKSFARAVDITWPRNKPGFAIDWQRIPAVRSVKLGGAAAVSRSIAADGGGGRPGPLREPLRRPFSRVTLQCPPRHSQARPEPRRCARPIRAWRSGWTMACGSVRSPDR